jgi:hypothetical protein
MIILCIHSTLFRLNLVFCDFNILFVVGAVQTILADIERNSILKQDMWHIEKKKKRRNNKIQQNMPAVWCLRRRISCSFIEKDRHFISSIHSTILINVCVCTNFPRKYLPSDSFLMTWHTLKIHASSGMRIEMMQKISLSLS